MVTSSKPAKWVKRQAKDLRPGDCDKFGDGPGMENSFRTVSRVEFVGNGIVHVYHRETIPSYYDMYGETFEVLVSTEPLLDEREAKRRENHAK